MFRQATFAKIVCALVGLALLVPVLAYAAVFTMVEAPYPSGGAGPAIVESFVWGWTIDNNGSQVISANANWNTAHFMREIPGWFDETKWTAPSGSRYNSTIPVGGTWQDSYPATRGYSSMSYGNKYHWDWQAWNANASDSTNGYKSGRQGGSYNCNQ